mmetsp:Transcript_50278/g.98560  ORF Transcript_50278/g.98560 Transcript_50278/m.98560 type:complete len:218 (-) Transcript_50278:55-708(-)
MTSPQQVLDFWFGEGRWGTPAIVASMDSQSKLWWGSASPEESKKIDESAYQFVDAVRACGKGELDKQAEWVTVDGLYAQMLLCDQLSRNCFRGTSEAFAYDTRAMELARQLFDLGAHKHFVLPEFTFLTCPGQHSEQLADHVLNMQVCAFLQSKVGSDHPYFTLLQQSCQDHKAVVERFGRYPHRNASLGRASTPEEQQWLADYENLPSWARSQMKN